MLQLKGDEKVEITKEFLKREFVDTLGVLATPVTLMGLLAGAICALMPSRREHPPSHQATIKPPTQGEG